ncbi:myosin-crossreactive antigen [Clostridium sp. CAG:451]|nr:myosin-crossreactive antigen [Clostridium sp. CAG:451]
MYYGAGTYEAFARPEKPEGVDKKSAYIIGTGLAGLSAAFYLVRDGRMKGEHIHLLEKLDLAGGSCDGRKDITKGFYMRGGREMDNHFECMWDMFRSVPSIETPDVSVLDEYYWLNKHDPNYSLCRATINCGEDAHTDKLFKLDRESAMALSKLFLTPEKALENKKISDVLPESFWKTNFWLYWQTMFAFQKWSSALEMKRYLCRYVHHIDGLPDFSALRFTKYNQYESMILPLIKYLKNNGVKIDYGIDVKNVIFKSKQNKKVATKIVYENDGETKEIDLTEDDLVFITNGCCTDTSCYGDQDNAPDLSIIKNGKGESWNLWKNIASQASNGEFGNPDKFCNHVDKTNWMSATIEVSDDDIIKYIINICKRDPRDGKVTTGGIVTVKDSMENWYLSWTINRQPQFKSQNKNSVLVWLYALNTNKSGNFVKKPIKECTGKEVCEEWLYHIGLPINEIEKYADICNTTTCYMPYINAFFQPRKEKDRPLVVPKNSVNFAFVGQFAETPRDTIFTTEYSIRTGMEAVYTLLKVDRAVPEVWGSKYDVRELLKACYYAVDKKTVDELPLTFVEKQLIKVVMKKAKGTDIEILLKDSGLFK